MPSLPSQSRPADGAIATLAVLGGETSLGDLVAGFVPPARFAAVSFDSYRPDPAHPSQAAAVSRLRRFVGELRSRPTGVLGRLRSLLAPRPSVGRPGVYLDGSFGVGKTHLLAATYHAADVPRVYLSFAELTQSVVNLGLAACVAEYRRYQLICVDEFELDDVASTRMAAAFLRGLWAECGTSRVVATSNTLPTELGRGRFAADDFAREIGEIAAAFEVLRIEGEDYRHRSTDLDADDPAVLDSDALRSRYLSYTARVGAKVYASHSDLLAYLSSLHPIHYGRLAESLDALFLDGLGPIRDQDSCLRFVHLVDKLYDRQVRLFVSTSGHLRDVFPAEYRLGGYSRKYGRCLSRLHELLAESASERG
jgi:cell division protein ZapE